MKLGPQDLSILSRLTDQWLELEPLEREGWRVAAIAEHPQLKAAIDALADPSQDMHLTPELTSNEAGRDSEEHDFSRGQRIGPYRLDTEIGRGGMGVVWLAQQADEHIQRTVALKLPWHHSSQKGLRTRFARERNILAALDHPGIAKLFDAGVSRDGQPYMAMQYVPGVPITEFCDAQNLNIQARIGLFIELLDAVQHAHSNLVVHRDLKPSNTLVTQDGQVVLLDFGIAKMLDADLSNSVDESTLAVTEFVGTALTLDYASPEQVAGKQVSTRSDIYSLGVILYEVLCGQRPYRLRRNSRAALEDAVLEQDISLPSTRVSERQTQSTRLSRRNIAKVLQGDLDAIVVKALCKVPENRYATAQALSDDLQRWLRKEPVSAQPDKLGYRVRRLLVRRWKLITATSVVAMALLVTASLALYQAVEATRATKAAQDETRKAQAVTAFLKDLFNTNTLNQADPAAARKRTAEELLDDGAKRIEKSLKDAPEMQIELMNTMAALLQDMRLGDQAINLREKSTEVARSLYGVNHPKTVSSIAYLASLYLDFNNPVVANRVFSTVRPQFERLASSDDLELRRAAAEVADGLLLVSVQSNFRDSLQTAYRVEKLYSTLPVAEFSYGRHFYLANVFFKNFALNDAELHYEMAERLRVQDGGWGGATIPTWQAQLFAFEGRYAKAEERFTVARAIEVHEQVPGVAQSNWVVCQLANYLTDTSRPRESLALTKEVLSKSPVIPEGKPSPHSLWAKGKALIRIGHVEEGLQFVTQAKSIASAADDKLAEIHITYDHIQALLELGRLVDAEVLLGAELELLQAGEFERNSDSRPYWRFVVTMATLQLNSVKARAFFEQSRDVLIPNGVGNLELSMFDSLAASIEQLEQKPDLALRRTELALDRIANSPDQLLLREWQAKHEELRGISLAALGRPAEAQRSFQTALEVNKAIFDPNTSISVGRVALRLAMLHKAAGRTGIAKTYQAQADAIRRTHPMFEQWIL